MKKVFSVLTVAVLAVSTVFAGFGGKATITAGADFDNGNFGFLGQGTGVSLDVDLKTESGEAQGEGDIYASIKGSLDIAFLGDSMTDNAEGKFVKDVPFGVKASVKEAKVGGENWSVSILGMPGAPDYAKSAIDAFNAGEATDKWGRGLGFPKFAPVSYKAPYAGTNGVTVEAFGYKAGFGLLGDYNKDNTKVNAAVFAETPEYDFNGFTVKAGATYAYNEIKKLDKGVVVPADKKTNAMGISAKLGYANEDLKLSASAATDVGVDFTAKKDNVAADLAVNFTYDFLNLDFYYNSAKNNLVSLGVDVDLNSVKVPVVLSVSAKDLVNDQELGLAVETTPVEGLTVSAYGDYAIASKDWDAGLGAEYEAEKFTVAGGFDLANAPEKVQLAANVSVESDAIINGATIGLGWSAADLLDVDPEEDCNYGAVKASCTIKF